MLEKGKDHLERRSEKWRSINWSASGTEYPANSKTKEGELDWSHLDYFEIVQSETSANEDNSFRNHIR